MRKYHAATNYKESIFIIGGEGFKKKILDDSIIFDTYNSKFIEIKNPNNPFSKGIYHTAIVEV